MPVLELIELPTKQVKRTEYTKHPFSKKRLRVIDVFSPAKRIKIVEETVLPEDPDLNIQCPSCTIAIDKILVVETDSPNAGHYHVLACGACNSQSWYVILD